MIRFTMTDRVRRTMIAHALAEFPNECCGLLAGTISNEVASAHCAYELTNERASPTTFRSEPNSMFRAMKQIRESQKEIVGVYHSHPSSDAVPSKRDWEELTYPDSATVIIGWVDSDPIVRAWFVQNGSFVECPIVALEE